VAFGVPPGLISRETPGRPAVLSLGQYYKVSSCSNCRPVQSYFYWLAWCWPSLLWYALLNILNLYKNVLFYRKMAGGYGEK